MNRFAERLRDLRLEKELTIKQLADKLGVRDSTITRWENNIIKPNSDNLYVIALFFGVSTDYLLGLED